MENREFYMEEVEDEVCSCCRTEEQDRIITELEEQLKKRLEKDEHENILKGKQSKIINHYGLDHQYDRLIEECSELIKAICKYKRFDTLQSDILCTADIVAEMADVLNLIEQIQLKDPFVSKGVSKVKDFKVDRELDRISKKI